MNTSRTNFRVAFGFAFTLLVGVNQLSAGGFFIPAPVTTYTPPVQVYVPPVVHTYVPPVQTYVAPVVHTYVPPAPTYVAPVHVNVAPTHVNTTPSSTYTAPTHVNAAPRTTYTPSSSNEAAPVHHSHTVSRPAPASSSSESAESESPRSASTHSGRTHVANSTPTTETRSPSASVSSAGKLPASHFPSEVHTGDLASGGHTWKRPTSSGSIPPAPAASSVASGHLPPAATTAGTAGSGHGWKRPTTPVATVPLGGSATGSVAVRPSGFPVPHHGTGPVQNLGRDGSGASSGNTGKSPLFAANPGSTPISGGYRSPDGHRHTNSFGVATSGGGHPLGSDADGSSFSASGYSAQDHLNDIVARNQAFQDSWSQFSDQVQAAVQDSLNNPPPDAGADPNQYVDQPPQLDAAPDQDFAPPPQAMMAYNEVATQPGDAQPQYAPQATQDMPAAPAQVASAPARSRRVTAAPDVASTALPDAAPVDTLAPPTDGFDGQPANGGATAAAPAANTALSVPALPPAPTQTEAAADYTALVQTPGVDADGFAGNNGGSSRWDKASQDYLSNVSATAADGSDSPAGTPTVWGRMANASVVMTASEMVSAMQGGGGGNLQNQLKAQNSPEAAYAAKWVSNLMSGVAGGPSAAAKSIREGANMMMAKMNEAFDTLPTLMNPNQSSSAPDSARQ